MIRNSSTRFILIASYFHQGFAACPSLYILEIKCWVFCIGYF